MKAVRLPQTAEVIARRAVILCLMVLIALSALAQTDSKTGSNTGAVNGAVIINDANGPSYIPGADVTLSGASELQTQTDTEGKFKFPTVVPGTYSVTVKFTGLESKPTTIVIQPGAVAEITLEASPAAVKSSVDVTATEEQVQTSSSTATIASTTIANAPNANDRASSLLPLVPGVVRGPDGRINMKGGRTSQSGALVNSANITDPATGNPGLDLPIDVVSSVQVISNPYDPQYGKLTGAVSTIDTKTSNYNKFHFSIQNVAPRLRVRGGSVLGIGGATPRMTLTGPIVKDRVAFTQSIEYRYIRTPVNSLPAAERDTTFEGVNSYSQVDLNLTPKQTATISVALYPQKLKYLGLNTFTPQPSTPDYHQRGYQVYGQHRYVAGDGALLTSQLSYKTFDADITTHNSDPYRLLVETTEGGFFNQQTRRSDRFDLQETYQFAPRQFAGTHNLKVGLTYAHSTYDGWQTFLPVELDNVSGTPIERITFGESSWAKPHQHETSWFAADQWRPWSRLSFDFGLRFDSDTITSSVHAAPRGGFQLALTGDGRTMLKGGGGLFYDRVPLMIAGFESLPDRTASFFDSAGTISDSIRYVNRIAGDLENPRSTAWNVSLSREVLQQLVVEVGYEHRQTSHDFVVSPALENGSSSIDLSNTGGQSYREFKVVGRYGFHGQVLNASYVRSRAYGNLNDFSQFYGNLPRPVIQPQEEGRLPFDAPNRFLAWGEFNAPWKVTLMPVYDVHTGFPYSVQDEYRQYIGQRNSRRYPRFSSFDIQVLRPFSISVGDRHIKMRAGLAVFNVFGHFNPRDVQSIQASPHFGELYNDAWREFRGKLVFHF
jgi:Carboxypeptidase regulatory-like domain